MGKTYHSNETFTINNREYKQMPNMKKKRKIKPKTFTKVKDNTITTLNIDLSMILVGILIWFICDGEYILAKVIVSILCLFAAIRIGIEKENENEN